MVKYNVKSSFWQKHDIFSQFMRSFCTWHFLENMFERCRFWRKCLMKKCRKIEKIKNVNFDMKIKNRITTRYYFCSINTFWYPSNHFFGFLKLYFFGIILVYFWYISRAEFLPSTVWEKKTLFLRLGNKQSRRLGARTGNNWCCAYN